MKGVNIMLPKFTRKHFHALQTLQEYSALCGCECHSGAKCPFAENVGNSVCIPLLADRFIQYSTFSAEVLPAECQECGAGCGKTERAICLSELGGLS